MRIYSKRNILLTNLINFKVKNNVDRTPITVGPLPPRQKKEFAAVFSIYIKKTNDAIKNAKRLTRPSYHASMKDRAFLEVVVAELETVKAMIQEQQHIWERSDAWKGWGQSTLPHWPLALFSPYSFKHPHLYKNYDMTYLIPTLLGRQNTIAREYARMFGNYAIEVDGSIRPNPYAHLDSAGRRAAWKSEDARREKRLKKIQKELAQIEKRQKR